MTPDEFTGALARLGWTEEQLAKRLGINSFDFVRWHAGDPIDKYVAEYLRVMLLLQEAVG